MQESEFLMGRFFFSGVLMWANWWVFGAVANDFKSALSQEETVASNSRAKDHENPAPFPSEPTTGNTNEPGAIMRRITRMPTLIIPGLELEWRDVGCQYKMGSTNKIVLEGTVWKCST